MSHSEDFLTKELQNLNNQNMLLALQKFDTSTLSIDEYAVYLEFSKIVSDRHKAVVDFVMPITTFKPSPEILIDTGAG